MNEKFGYSFANYTSKNKKNIPIYLYPELGVTCSKLTLKSNCIILSEYYIHISYCLHRLILQFLWSRHSLLMVSTLIHRKSNMKSVVGSHSWLFTKLAHLKRILIFFCRFCYCIYTWLTIAIVAHIASLKSMPQLLGHCKRWCSFGLLCTSQF